MGCELVDKLHELVDIVSNRRGLADVEELAKEQLVFVAVEMFMDHGIECSLIHIIKMTLHRLKLGSYGADEVHSGHPNPKDRINKIHLEIRLNSRYPKLGVITIKFGDLSELGGGRWIGG
jgi:hypothetical protein